MCKGYEETVYRKEIEIVFKYVKRCLVLFFIKVMYIEIILSVIFYLSDGYKFKGGGYSLLARLWRGILMYCGSLKWYNREGG